MKLKGNMKARLKNVYFWLGIVSAFLLAARIEPSTITTWDKLFKALLSVFSNPYLLAYTVVDLLSIFVEPTSPGLRDAVTLKEQNDIIDV